MTVLDMVREALQRDGYDGLSNYLIGCACRLDDLASCDEPSRDCEAGWERPGCDEGCGDGCDFHIVPGRRPA